MDEWIEEMKQKRIEAKKWRVRCFEYFGLYHWQVYRLKDSSEPDEYFNREYKGAVFDTEADAQQYADFLNESKV